MRASPSTIRRRRILAFLAIIAALAATAAGWQLLFGADEPAPRVESQTTGADLSARVRSLLEPMRTAEKLDQILLLGFDGTAGDAAVLEDLGDRDLGGLLVSGGNWIDPSQGADLLAALREATDGDDRIPPLLVAAQEGGTHRSLAGLPPEDREIDIGDFADPERAAAWAAETSDALKTAGFDLNLFPVADVGTLDGAVADRAFSDDPRIAASMTAAAIAGCEQWSLACAPLHFPGIGAASQDPDLGPATVSLDAATLTERDLAPFAAAFAAGAPAVVVGHAFYAAYDPVTPASLSRKITVGLLREQLGFAGVAITDDLGAGAINANNSVEGAAVQALAAGADLLLVGSPKDQRGLAEALQTAVSEGAISEERLDEAAGRVLQMKIDLGLIGA